MIGNIRSLFPLTVYTVKAGISEEDRYTIVEHIDSCAEKTDDEKRDYSWTGDINGHHDLQHHPLYRSVINAMSLGIYEYMAALGYNSDRFVPYFTKCWGVKQSETRTVPHHDHGSAHISAVYYPRVPEGSGAFALTHFNHPNEFFTTAFNEDSYADGNVSRTVHTDAEQYIKVEDDLLLLFPSKTKHRTMPNKSSEPRYSVTADIVLTMKSVDRVEYGLPPLELWKKAEWSIPASN